MCSRRKKTHNKKRLLHASKVAFFEFAAKKNHEEKSSLPGFLLTACWKNKHLRLKQAWSYEKALSGKENLECFLLFKIAAMFMLNDKLTGWN